MLVISKIQPLYRRKTHGRESSFRIVVGKYGLQADPAIIWKTKIFSPNRLPTLLQTCQRRRRNRQKFCLLTRFAYA
ncbi:hypothetical protein Plhal304r1_c011g0044431 [Plasmopara halstedii]